MVRKILSKFAGRIIATLEDFENDEVWPHGAVAAPASMRTEAQVLKAIDKAFDDAVKANPDEWSYDNVHDNLAAMGFEYFAPLRWVEPT